MNQQTTIFLTTAIAIILIAYTLIILTKASLQMLGKVRGGILLQLFGLFMVALAFLWGTIGLLLQWSLGLVIQQIFLFIGIVLMFFAARRLFAIQQPETKLASGVMPHPMPRGNSSFTATGK